MPLLPDLLPAGPVELRRWSPDAAESLCEAVASSLAELRPWMPWAQEAPTVPGTAQVLTDGTAAFGADREWQYVVADPGTDRIVGSVGLHRRGAPGTIEIGYWIRTDATHRGLATAGARALTTAAFAHLRDVDSVEIRMDARNARSAAVPRRLGFHLVGEIDRPVEAPGQSGRWLVWAMPRADWDPASS